MNLAAQDIRHNLGRFALTAVGIGLLLMIVLGMSGIYRGMIDDALVVVDRIGADFWVVQRGTRGRSPRSRGCLRTSNTGSPPSRASPAPVTSFRTAFSAKRRGARCA